MEREQSIDHNDPSHKCDCQEMGDEWFSMEERGYTHGDRIIYLQKLKDAKLICPAEEQNLEGAICYHQQFPSDSKYPEEELCFQDGKPVFNREELVRGSPIWYEGVFLMGSMNPANDQSYTTSRSVSTASSCHRGNDPTRNVYCYL